MFKIQSGLSAFEPEVLLAEIDRQTKDKVFYNAAYVEQLKKQITNSAKGKQRDLDELADPTAKPSRQRLDIVVFRNHPSALAIDPLLKFIADDTRDKQLRLSAIETLGWFNENYRRQEIISGLQNISTDDPDLQNEIKKTIRRLSPDGNTHEKNNPTDINKNSGLPSSPKIARYYHHSLSISALKSPRQRTVTYCADYLFHIASLSSAPTNGEWHRCLQY